MRNHERVTLWAGGLILAVYTPAQGIADAVRFLLRHHLRAREGEPDPHTSSRVLVDWLPADLPDGCYLSHRPDLERNRKHLVWDISRIASDWHLEDLYYRILFPVLRRVFAVGHRVWLQGALLEGPDIGTVLILGERGAGKSSTAAGWLEAGGTVVTDKTVLLDLESGAVRCYGLHREFHLEDRFLSHLPKLRDLRKGLQVPDGHRYSFDWFSTFHPDGIGPLPAPTHIIHSQVDSAGTTKLRRLSRQELKIVVENRLAAEAGNRLLTPSLGAAFYHELQKAQGWEIRWGPDIWSYPGLHMRWLSRQIYQMEEQ